MNKRKTIGFTLFELMIVVAIFAILIGISASFFSLSNQNFVLMELERLYAYSLYLQRKAIVTGETQEIYFDNDRNMYKANNILHKFNKVVEFGIMKNVKGPPSNPIKTINNPITFKSYKMVLSPDGSISSGTIYLTDKNKKVLYALTSGIAQVPFLRRYRYLKDWNLI